MLNKSNTIMCRDISNMVFGKLKAIKRNEGVYGRGNCNWFCMCDCGNTTSIPIYALIKGKTKSCGCLRKIYKGGGLKHGLSNSSEYRIWAGIQRRCYLPTDENYHNYGGRGIKVCDRWRRDDGFLNFFLDMGERPSIKHSLDRFPNNDGNYEPQNCRWATAKEQCRNQRINVLLTINGVTRCASEWAEIININPNVITTRKRKGFSDYDCIYKPLRITDRSNCKKRTKKQHN